MNNKSMYKKVFLILKKFTKGEKALKELSELNKILKKGTK